MSETPIPIPTEEVGDLLRLPLATVGMSKGGLGVIRSPSNRQIGGNKYLHPAISNPPI